MKIKFIPFLILLLCNTAVAVEVTYNNTVYDVTAVFASVEDYDLFEQQPWWNDESAADYFAAEIQFQLGSKEGYGEAGPVFAFEDPEGNQVVRGSIWSALIDGVDKYSFTCGVATGCSRFSVLFAVAEEIPLVPVPAAAWLFGSALIGLLGVKRRR